MVLTEDQSKTIQEDLLNVFQQRYGESWRDHLTKHLRPSPLAQIAEQRGVPLADVRRVRSQFSVLGQFFELYKTLVG